MDNISFQPEKSAKKLVQARLPFKLLSTVEKNELVLNSTEKPKSKDLNLEEPKSTFKESVGKKIRNDSEDVIILSEEDEDQTKGVEEINLQQNISITHDKQNKTPDHKPSKVFIKLPISSKKKRKLSVLNQSNELEKTINQIEDIGKSPDVKSNPTKKAKISNFVVQNNKDDTPVKDRSPESVEHNLKNKTISNLTCDKLKNFNESLSGIMEVDTNDVKVDSNEGSNSAELNLRSEAKTNLEENISITTRNLKKIDQIAEEATIKQGNCAEKNSLGKLQENYEDDKTNVLNDENKEDFENFLSDSSINLNLEISIIESTEDNELENEKSIDVSDADNVKNQSISSSKVDMKKDRNRSEKEEQRRKEKEAREQKRLQERLEKEEKRRKEKEDKEKKRLAEIEARSEEKRQKEEEKRKKDELKEEERRKREEIKEEEKRKRDELKEEERKKKEEIENKKKKAAEVFTKFFVPSRNSKGIDEKNSTSSENKANIKFMPFQIKDDMKLAPTTRRQLDIEQKNVIDEILNNDLPYSELYVTKLKCSDYQPLKSDRTICKVEDDDDVVIVDEMHGIAQCIDGSSKTSKKYKAKFLLFRENRRPPYYGTWRKKSSTVTSRKPFATDKKMFDYEVDSDLEWEEEEPGESLSCSDGEKESEDDYEVDNEFFVPHGHLSDEELEEEEDQSPEVQKAKLKILQQEFVSEMKKKTEKIKPRLIGVVWSNKDLSKPQTCPSIVWEFLKRQEMFFKDKINVLPSKEKLSENVSPTQQEKQKLIKRFELPEEFITSLIKLVHGNANNKLFIIKEFQAFLAHIDPNQEKIQYTKSCIRERIEKMAQWKIIKNKKKKFLCWVVSKEFLEKYDLADLSIQNKWNYIIPPKNKREIMEDEEIETSKVVKSNESSPAITKFTKILTKDKNEVANNKQQIPIINKNATTVETKLLENIQEKKNNTIKKRVPILFSVPRGQNVPEASKKNVVDDYLKQAKTSFMLKPNATTRNTENIDCVVIE